MSTKLQKSPVRWPLFVLSLPALVAIWSGWVGIGEMTGFGPVKLLPGIADDFTINTAITLPIGLETYAAYSMYAWLTAARLTQGTRRFAKWSAFGSLALGMLGQIAFHLLVLNGIGTNSAPVVVTIGVSAIPVLVVGFGIGLAHAMHRDHIEATETLPEKVELTSGEIVVPDADWHKPVSVGVVPDLMTLKSRPAMTARTSTRTGMRPETKQRYIKGVRLYRESLKGPGRPISQRDLAAALDMKNRDLAKQIINDATSGKVMFPDETNAVLQTP